MLFIAANWGRVVSVSLPNLGSFPLFVTFGHKSGSAPFRCRFCLGRVGSEEPGDPSCPRPGKAYQGHTWLTVENPVTSFFRSVVERHWQAECQSQPGRLSTPEQYRAKARLEATFAALSPHMHRLFGTAILLRFNLPTRTNK